MKKICLWVSLSLIWLALLFIPFFYYSKQLQFPVLVLKHVLIPVLLFFAFIPFIFVIIAKTTCREKKLRIIFSILVSLEFAVVFMATLGFTAESPFFYPLVSYTENAENYLILDVGFYGDEEIVSVFPKEIPQTATDISYKYYCDGGSNMAEIFATWKLPKEDYIAEKKRISELAISVENMLIYRFDSFAYNLIVEFDENEHSVCYTYEQEG